MQNPTIIKSQNQASNDQKKKWQETYVKKTKNLTSSLELTAILAENPNNQ